MELLRRTDIFSSYVQNAKAYLVLPGRCQGKARAKAPQMNIIGMMNDEKRIIILMLY